ncbi:DUF202 domain-containing protein [Zafaria sp. Z1313]|uniref:DUF202 domain-containing protein n=1 Tax=unclassified Zafaria TaxID=2828765 RepID=UPI002E79FB0B|nr:DUF202 domain-containing protein [Zafaria sp. J156]MEE1622558.1 DUF202 domain-containing protein [Zafaria sp. J156]
MPAVAHGDPGLQPERTSLAWGRTMLALFLAAGVLLRWLPFYGYGALAPAVVAAAIGAGIYATQKHRYAAATRGIAREALRADAVAVCATGAAVCGLGVLGAVVVLGA